MIVDMCRVAVCTIISPNYLAFARVLAQSYKEHNPTGEVYVLIIGADDGAVDWEEEPFTVIRLEELAIPSLETMAFIYDVVEFNTSVKPFLLAHLFEMGFAKAIYLDPDIMVTAPLTPLLKLLDRYSVVLTPHVLAPINDTDLPNEMTLLRAGAYNLGFLALRQTPDTQRLLLWWSDRLAELCYVDPQSGLFVDQKWMDLAPSLFDGVQILRDPGYNVAYWNLHERRIAKKDAHYIVNDVSTLRFFHFSGIDIHNLDRVSKYQNRVSLPNRPDLQPLFEEYSERLRANGLGEMCSAPYPFGAFRNGDAISLLARRLYAALRPLERGQHFHSDPFAVGQQGTFHNWLRSRGLLDSARAKHVPNSEDDRSLPVKREARLLREYKTPVRILAFGMRQLRFLVGTGNYLKFLKLLEFISSSRQQHLIFALAEIEDAMVSKTKVPCDTVRSE
jgi:hypothetical protein